MSTQERTSPQQRWVLALTSLGALMVALDTLVVAAALQTIRQDLGASVDQLQWTVNAYTLSFAMLLMVAAALGDRWGRRRMFATGLGLFTAASAACALAPSVGWLITARAVQGIGAALVMPLAMGLLGAAFPPQRRGWATGIFSGLTGLGVLGGPVLGGAVTQGFAWQWIFWINVPVGVIAVLLVLLRIEESKGPVRPLDPVGTALITLAVLGVIWGVVRGEPSGWGSAEVITAFAVGAVLLAAFTRWEMRTAHPMLPLRYFRIRAFSAGNAAGFFLTAALFGAVFFMAQFMQVAFGSGPLAAGLRLLPWTGTLFVVAPVAGRLVDKVGERPLVVAGLVLQAVGVYWISAASSGTHYGTLVIPMIIAGCGISMALPAAQSASTGALPREAIGLASGIYSMMRQTGGAVGVAVLSAVFAAAGGYQAFGDGFRRALLVCAMISLLGAVSGLFLRARRSSAYVSAPSPAAQPVKELR